MKRKILSGFILAILIFTFSGIANLSFAADETLSEKINKAANGETITLDSDCSEKIVIPNGKNITLNLNGKKVTPYGITVKDGATVKITGNGTVDAKEASTAALYVEDGGNATVENGTFSSYQYYCVLNHGTAVVNNGTFKQGEGNKKNNSSLVDNGYYEGKPSKVKTAKLTINGGTFTQDYSTTSAIKSDSYGDTTIVGGSFTSKNGNLIQVSGNVVVKGGTFTNNVGPFMCILAIDKIAEPGTISVSGGTITSKTLINTNTTFKEKGEATITGGKFNIDTMSSSKTDDNLKIYGGSFTQDPSKFIANGYKAEKGENFTVRKNEVIANTGKITIDTNESVNKIVLGISADDKDTVDHALSNLSSTVDDAIRKALNNEKNNDLEAVVNTEEISENKVDKTVLSSINKTVSDKKLTVSQYLDIKVLVKELGSDKIVDTISQTPSAIKFTVLVPNDLLKDGRKFYVLRNHDGETKVLDTKQDGNKLTFETDKFSTYAVAYADTESTTNSGTSNTTNTTGTTNTTSITDTTNTNSGLDETPKTGVASPIVFLSILSAISVAGILVFKNK